MKVRVASCARVGWLAWAVATSCWGAEPKVLDAAQVALEFAQRSWQHEEGLPAGDRVHAILQARDGYIWAATQRGLTRFDGRNFTVFDHVNTPCLASDDCRTLAEDQEGNLWVGTPQSLIRKSGQDFTAFNGQLGRNWMPSPPLCASRGGGVWVGGSGLISRIRGEVVEVYTQDQTFPTRGGSTTCLEEDEEGFLWIGTTTGLARFDTKRRRFEAPEGAFAFKNRPVVGMCAAPGGARWILFLEGLFRLGEARPTTSLTRLEPGQWPKPPTLIDEWPGPDWYGRSLAPGVNGALWVSGRSGGVFRYDRGEMEFLPFQVRGVADVSLTTFIDREENLWVGTERNGLHRWTPRKFSSCTTRNGLAHDNVWSIWECRDGSLLVGTDGGVTHIVNGQSQILRRADGSVHKDVRAVVEDAEGTFWIGTMRSLECIRKGVSDPVNLPGEWFEEKVRALLPGRDGAMWIGTVRGLTRLHNGRRIKYTRADGLGSDEIRAMLEDRTGRLWVGTLGGGLSLLDNGRFTTLTTTNGLSSNNVWALHEDSEGKLWIGTDNGLNLFQDGRMTSFTMAEGLPDRLVNSILSDGAGRLWVGHDRGIYAVEKQQLLEVAQKTRTAIQALTFDDSDGMLSIETNGQKSYPAACSTRDGRLWFLTTQGIAILDPAKISHHQVAPLAVIEEVRANGKRVFGNGAGDQGKGGGTKTAGPDLSLPPGGARVLEIQYTANTFVAPEKARFKYRLTGLGQHWIEAGTRRQAYFTDLRPGHYRFELLACNHHGVWQEKSAMLDFHVAPFFYQTWWFYAACGICVSGLIVMIIGWQARVQRRIYRLERANALNEQRKQIARDIHDELGASLTHIIRLSDRVSNGRSEAETSNLQARRIAAIAGEAVDNIGEIVWSNNPEYDTLEDLAAYLREYAANFFVGTGITAQLDFPHEISPAAVTGLFRRHLVLLIKEALQNVSKHAEASHVTVRMTLPKGQLELSVTDDGRGLPMESERGNGLHNMRQRVTELNGTLEIVSHPGRGTAIRALVPLEDAWPGRRPVGPSHIFIL